MTPIVSVADDDLAVIQMARHYLRYMNLDGFAVRSVDVMLCPSLDNPASEPIGYARVHYDRARPWRRPQVERFGRNPLPIKGH